MALCKLIMRVTVYNLYFWILMIIVSVPTVFFQYLEKKYPVDAKIIRSDFLLKTSPQFCQHIDKAADAAKITAEINKNIDSNGKQSRCKPTRLQFNITEKSTVSFESYDYRTQHGCLLDIVNKYNRKETVNVPNVVHNIWMDPRRVEYRFHHFACTLSMLKNLQPDLLIIWYDSESSLPRGVYWSQLIIENLSNNSRNTARNRRSKHGKGQNQNEDLLKSLRRNKQSFEEAFRRRIVETFPTRVIFVRRPMVELIFGRQVVHNEHCTDVVRLEALLMYGGIYLDNDVFVLRSFEPLRAYRKAVLGYEAERALCNSIIVAPRNASFLRLWYAEYEVFDNREWSFHSVHLPGLLADRCPEYVHPEANSLNRPSWKELDLLYGIGKYANLSQNYAVHLWFRFHDVDYTPESILAVQTTVGRLFRLAYFGFY